MTAGTTVSCRVQRRIAPALVGLLVALSAGGCQPPTSPTAGKSYAGFDSENPAVRVQAIIEAGNAKDEKALSHLIDRLTDSESDVRFFAYVALKDITGQDLGYRPWQEPRQREEGQRKWRTWLAGRTGQGPVTPASEPATSPSSAAALPTSQPASSPIERAGP